ncbi:bifunctional riboflavin kinase/FAD synthetase [Maribacter algicola]|uniref:Bifunctional riboflavin kinase/FAD synthetase n=1 Tax=Meishania litoralis TaxID=3434685 RepID=A0ACC7LHN9_9FLAO
MLTVQSITKFDEQHSTVLTIGTFDGVHVGHREILRRLTKSAAALGLKSTVLTFFPHPRMVLQKDSDIKLLNTINEKANILGQLGIDCLIVHPFTIEFSRLTATQFVRDNLVNKLGMKKIIIGYDHRFGRNRTANINDLRAFGSTLGFEVEEISAQEIDDVSVSSTKIRKALENGDVLVANQYLGYAYMLTGTIIKGRGLGRQIGFPTANLHIPETYKLIPKNGVYAVEALLNGKRVHGMMNIGFNPTVADDEQRSIEVNFFDFEADLYGQEIQVNVLHRLRNETKFESVEALRQQLMKDKENAIALISK